MQQAARFKERTEMRGLSVRLATQHHAKAGELLDRLQDAFGLDDVEVTLTDRIRRTERDMPGVGYSYDRATDEDQSRLGAILTTVLGV